MKLRFKNRSSRGIAILTVLVFLALMLAIVSELSNKEIIRYKLAINERDALQAEALAQSGANFSKIILAVQEPLQGMLANLAKLGIQLPAFTVWELMPIDSDLLKGIVSGDFLPDFGLGAKKEESPKRQPENETTAKSVPLAGPYVIPEGGYGGFKGRFSSEIEDEERKISIRRWAKLAPPRRRIIADQIARVLNKAEYSVLFDGTLDNNRNLTPAQLIGNIYDYISEDELAVDVNAQASDWGRILSGDKKTIYVNSPGIVPKRASLDSPAELRLIPGVTDAIYQVLSKHITIYGESDKINILSASDSILDTVFYLCSKNKNTGPLVQPGFTENLLTQWHRDRDEGKLEISADGVIAFLERNGVEVDKKECEENIGTESKTFTVRSTATVGNVTKTILMRLRSAGGITSIYQYQYL
ncbi:MAG: general secretion pathway protein GspK [Myxococcales bacterium]|nr:general secretion pathway protein GspK [Myxococcales bacterium]USN49888.1 MAG: general secretion pathway protein GspK [Myxococcales bacterium]